MTIADYPLFDIRGCKEAENGNIEQEDESPEFFGLYVADTINIIDENHFMVPHVGDFYTKEDAEYMLKLIINAVNHKTSKL